jgi:dTDP-4-amino-4,6-dideoxygalactose transaminase
MTDMQAALGLSQMARLNGYVERRHVLAKRYDEMLAHLPLVTPWQHPDSYSGLHLYVIRLEREKIQKSHRTVFEGLRARGIGVNLHYIPVHTQPHYSRMGFRSGDFPEAERYYQEAITLPIYPTMTEAQQDEVVSALTAELTT